MLLKTHLTSHSSMSGSRWVTIPLWLSRSLRSFWYSSSVYSYHLFLNSSAFFRLLLSSDLYRAYPCMKCCLDISNFLEEISSLFHFIVFPYFFALFTEEAFHISPCNLELCIQMGISFLFSFVKASLLFSAICKASSDNHFAFCISFSWGWSWSLSAVQCHTPPLIVLQALCQV